MLCFCSNRGQGIVTRRPLVLQLIHLVSERDNLPPDQHTASNAARRPSLTSIPSSAQLGSTSSSGKPIPPKQEYGEFLHMPGKRMHDFNEIRKEIENETWVDCTRLFLFLEESLTPYCLSTCIVQYENSRIIERHLKTAYPPQDLLYGSSQPYPR